MMSAWKNNTGGYNLKDGNDKGSTFRNREKIASLSGRWNASCKQWEISAEVVDKFLVNKLYVVILQKYCHTPSEMHIAGQIEVIEMAIHRCFCNRCDSMYGPVKILEVLGEGDDGMKEWNRRKNIG